jgi:hypothetical protein
VWVLAAIYDATGNIDAQIQITIDATKAPTCECVFFPLPFPLSSSFPYRSRSFKKLICPESPDSAVSYAITNLSPLASTTGKGNAATPATTTELMQLPQRLLERALQF